MALTDVTEALSSGVFNPASIWDWASFLLRFYGSLFDHIMTDWQFYQSVTPKSVRSRKKMFEFSLIPFPSFDY
jgi:hypothetical protein